ncbi:MAG TPA: hypothetical protein VEP66_18825 [Myxococcales bacterium]|nr:hypothetical protein [Myxococcales bacterium]
MGKLSSLLGIALAVLPVVSAAAAEGDAAALAAKLKEAKVSLQQGFSASAKSGNPISGKFEVEDGKLQLSVYTAKGDGFSEVIVDHKTGKVVKSEPITSGDDLTAAKAQSEAMAKAKTSLSAAVSRAQKANKGYRAVSATPSLKDGRPTADVTLLKGTESKTVSEALE